MRRLHLAWAGALGRRSSHIVAHIEKSLEQDSPLQPNLSFLVNDHHSIRYIYAGYEDARFEATSFLRSSLQILNRVL